MIELLFIIGMILVSLFVLIKGADYLINGAADLARFWRISPILVGLTIVAFGTSLPEFIVSVFSVMNGSADLSLGNIIGSNIANITLVLGICALLARRLKIKSKTFIYEIPFLVVSSFLLLILGSDFFIFGKEGVFLLSRFDGVIFMIIFALFIYYVFRSTQQKEKMVTKEFREEFAHKNSPWKNGLLIVGGIIALFAGGRLFVTYAGQLAGLAGLSKGFIGLTIAALGTSLPEVAASGMAAWKGKGNIAIGNIVGSNIFNVLFVLGATSLIKPIDINKSILGVDGIIMILVTLIFLVFATRRRGIDRKEGIALIGMYVLYMTFLIWRL